jgi:glycerol kinase
VKSLFKLKMENPDLVENAERIGDAGGIELNALIADQQAACVGEWALTGDKAKVTNGTGTFVDVPTEGFSRKGDLIPMVLLKHKGKVWFGVEGYLPTTGKAVDLMLSMGLIRDYSDLEVEASRGAIFIPALSGLQVPRAPNAKGIVAGLDLASDRGTVISGLLKAIAFHVKLVLEQSGAKPRVLRADGGLSRSNELLRSISAATGIEVERGADLEATSRGLAMLQLDPVGRGRLEELAKVRGETEVFSRRADAHLEEEYEKWQKLTTWLKSSKRSFQAE